jgi:formate hydrogenlyase transcriptional activator
MRRLLPLISGCVTRVVPHDFAGITLFDDDRKDMRVYILSSPETGTVVEPERSVAAKETLAIRAILAGKSQTFTRKDLVELNTPVSHHVLETGLNTVHCVPLMTAKGTFGTLNIGSKQDNAFSLQDHELLNQVAAQLAIALENAQAYREITDLKNRLEEEKLYLESEIQTELHFEEIALSSRPVGIAAQFSLMKLLFLRRLNLWMARAISVHRLRMKTMEMTPLCMPRSGNTF